jgi:hypothetical protein
MKELGAKLTKPISFNNTSRCCSKYDFSPTGCVFVEDEAGGLVVLEDILNWLMSRDPVANSQQCPVLTPHPD